MLNWLRNRFIRNQEEPEMTLAEIEAMLVDESKLTRSKRKFVQEQRFMVPDAARSTDRLPPGQTLTSGYPVLDLGVRPDIPCHEWKLTMDGLIRRPTTLDWNQLREIVPMKQTTDIHCVTSWSRFDNRFEGVSTAELARLCRPSEEAVAVMITGFDGYMTNLRLDDFLAPTSMLAHSWDGAPLTLEHGAPVRLIVPHLYFWKSAKWIRRITFMKEEKRGYWEAGGYHVRGDPWRQERYRGMEPLS